MQCLTEVAERVTVLDNTRKGIPPKLEIPSDSQLPDLSNFLWFGRLRRDTSVEHLAGDASLPPIIRPVELSLVPDHVDTFHDVAMAMRHALNLCILLTTQKGIIRNSYTLRVCLIQHLFLRVIPLPLPLTHPERTQKCFWASQHLRYETQADILRLLNMLSRQYAAASLSLKVTSSFDAVRILTFACMATITDAILRKAADDIPAWSSLHYSGEAEGPVKPFGFDIGGFAIESENLQFSCPEYAAARTQV
jgi:hypothetical protein